jgi:glyoxylase-like metal-dependent hydrolase (beta-lactamase superfamily II)
MKVTKIDNHMYLIDLELAGIENYVASYFLRGKKAALVETGPASTVHNMFTALKEMNVKPEEVSYVAVSHIHLDHAGGAGALLKRLPNAKIVVHQRGAPHVANPEKLWMQARHVLGNIAEVYGKPEPVPQEKIIPTTDDVTFHLGNHVELRAIETLGHASHHLSYYEPSSEGIFTGDAGGVYLNKLDTIVPTTPPPFRLDMALASLDKLINLKPKSLYYSHFGEADKAVEKLEAYSKQLKLWAIIAKRGIENGESLETISDRIFREDAAVKKAASYIRSHPFLSKTVANHSVQGIVDYVKRFGVPA